jgi:hypothetical protein
MKTPNALRKPTVQKVDKAEPISVRTDLVLHKVSPEASLQE